MELKEKLKQRFFHLPLHYIDSCIILKDPDTEDGIYCKKYLNKVPNYCRVAISNPALGEILTHLLFIKDFENRLQFLRLVHEYIIGKKFHIRTDQNIDEITEKIRETFPEIDPNDRFILAYVVEDKRTRILVTTDKILIKCGGGLKKEFGIIIKHPKDLI